LGVVAFEEGREFFAEDFPGWFFGEEDVIGAGQGNEQCAGDFGGEDAAFLRRGNAVTIGMKDDGRDRNGWEKRADVDVVASAHSLDEIFWGDGDELEILEPALIFVGGFFGDVEIGDDLEERRVGFAPVELYEGFEGAANFDGVGMTAVVSATRIGTA